MAHKWARWLHNPCRLGGTPPLQSGGQNQKWEILFFGGHATKHGFQTGRTISEIAHKWAQWQSEVGKLIFLVSHLLSKKKEFFLRSNLLHRKYFFFYVKLLSKKPTPRGKT